MTTESLLRPAFVASDWQRLDQSVRERIGLFGRDVLRFNQVQNLVSRVDPERELSSLVEESVRAGLACAALAGPWVDVGTGAGFPGLVLACMDPGRTVHLVERRKSRCEFLQRECRALGLQLVSVRNEDARSVAPASFRVGFSKALAEPSDAARLVGRLIVGDGSLVMFRRRGWAEVGAEAVPGWIVRDRWVSGEGSDGDEARAGFLLQRG